MRLLYSVSSPYARIVRIALLETGLDARVTKHEVTRSQLYSAQSDVLAFNPVGRVPTLVLDEGTVLTESKLILDYIDATNPRSSLMPRDGSDGWRTMAELGQAWGLLDGVVTWARASASPEPQHAVVTQETARVHRAADALEVAVAHGAYAGAMNAAHIVLGTALGLVETRLPVWKWREGRAGLAAWYDSIATRSSFRSTEPQPL